VKEVAIEDEAPAPPPGIAMGISVSFYIIKIQ